MLTAPTPARLMPPVTLPPPADETRVPATANGTLLVELQLPAWVAKITFQVPSYAPGRTVAASAAPGMAKAATTATAEIHRKARLEAKSVEWAIDRAEMVIFPSLGLRRCWRRGVCRAIRFHGSALPSEPCSVISPNFIARLIKGCRVDVRAGYFISGIA